MLTQTIILSATKYTVKPTVYAMQGDTGRVLNCAFSDFTVPEGATARLYIHRPNGTFYTETATVDGQVVAVDADQVLTTAGYVNCDLEIEADNETVQSFPFTVRVLATEAGSPQTTEKGVSVAELDERVTALEEAPQGAAWGSITGDIADQTDLKNALDGKLDGETSGTSESTFNGRLSHDTSDDSIMMKSGDTGVGATLIAGDGEITIGDDGYKVRVREGYAPDLGTNDGDEWTYSPIATEEYVSEHGGISQADADLRYLQLSGGTMTGNLKFSSSQKILGYGDNQIISFPNNNSANYTIGNNAKYGDLILATNAGKDLYHRHGDDGAYVVLDAYNTSANPTLSGGETTLTSLKLNGTNYAVGGGSKLYLHTIRLFNGDFRNATKAYDICANVISSKSTAYTLSEFKTYMAQHHGLNSKSLIIGGAAKNTDLFTPTLMYSSSDYLVYIIDSTTSSNEGFNPIGYDWPPSGSFFDTVTAL